MTKREDRQQRDTRYYNKVQAAKRGEQVSFREYNYKGTPRAIAECSQCGYKEITEATSKSAALILLADEGFVENMTKEMRAFCNSYFGVYPNNLKDEVKEAIKKASTKTKSEAER